MAGELELGESEFQLNVSTGESEMFVNLITSSQTAVEGAVRV